ncbi:hypothetical protein BX616_006576, partial [Lobosporangium transversale]
SKDNPDHFEKNVDIDRSQNVFFKFIVDGKWVCADEFITEYDNVNNMNNVLPPVNQK